MEIIRRLEDYICDSKIEDAISLVRHIGETKDESCLEVLLKHLTATDSNILRNEIALSLSDIGNNKAVDTLVEMLTHPKTKGSRGTLLYALEELNYIHHIATITDFIGDSSLEVSMEAFLLLEHVFDELSYEQKEKCKNILESKLKNNENEHIREALEMFE
ncbi:hypothetical protein BBG47_26015 [Paenibacillus sp. KS1]|uniref:HEAT repeat domain-containing protein n=1 Tax=Paenibacillus sp. KS1 TaxID=1849249 RepID=UPI000806672D|nr:HEAT repeat domain-containing protein [Paenibacillus sp. KS1]OBY76629.1 hypothetical protein BBG47_26015 [Paenibacillus sp. KS1]